MKRLIASLALVFSLLPFVAHAQAPTDLWKIEKFSVELDVQKDGFVDVTETITANFLQPRHGIYRYVPEQGKFSDGSSYNLGITLDHVTMDGDPALANETHENGNVVWRIGNPNLTITGTHVYVISYSARNAIGRFSDHDELYWNISGDGWDVPMPIVEAKLLLPDGVTTDRPSVCYTGAYGSKESDCTIVESGSVVGFVSKHVNEPMSIVAGFPKGSIGSPPFDAAGFAWKWVWWLMPILTLLFMLRAWEKNGKDERFGPLVAQYEPTDGLSPAALLSLIEQKSMATLSASIVHLAVKGYIDITEIKIPGAFGTGFGASRDYDLTVKKEIGADLASNERTTLTSLFRVGVAVGSVVRVSSLKNTFYVQIPIIKKAIADDLVAAGYFASDPNKVANKWRFPGFILLVVVIFGWKAGLYLATLPILATSVVFFAFAGFMVRWTDKGAKAAWEAKGFKEFVTQVEKYRGTWMAEQNIFEKVLPYAMAFGVATKWAKAFEGIQVPPPQWYHGSNGFATGFIASSFINDLNHFGADFNHAAVSTPQSRGSGSGFGGGGFSGGGGGGGGGGSW